MILKGRRICAGRASGKVVKSETPLWLLGGFDPKTGTVCDKGSSAFGKPLRGRILVFPSGQGSTVSPYVMYQMKLGKVAPAGIINSEAEVIVSSAAIISEIPMVDRIDVGLICDGDAVNLDATKGELELLRVTGKSVVTGFVLKGDKVLLLKRSQSVRTHKGLWAGVSGYMESGDRSPLERMLQELEEELRLHPEDASSIKVGEPVMARDKDVIWRIHPFALRCERTDFVSDWEHTEMKWVPSRTMGGLPTVPKLREALESATMACRRRR